MSNLNCNLYLEKLISSVPFKI